MGYEVIYHLDADPQSVRDRRPMTKELLCVVSHGSEIVLELERSSLNEWLIGTARSE
jgi:hypothetical protein